MGVVLVVALGAARDAPCQGQAPDVLLCRGTDNPKYIIALLFYHSAQGQQQSHGTAPKGSLPLIRGVLVHSAYSSAPVQIAPLLLH